ncbi:hypothetical protein N9J72_02940, partial [Candidatus Gracilibacteria bacterium]|nr:hypothetical protein [Candidatus Gracilibacteria bacterium]
MRKIAQSIMLLVVLLSTTNSYASQYPEVSCGNYSYGTVGCDQCFDAGGTYEGDVVRPYDIFNANSQDAIYFDHENPVSYTVTPMNNNTTWFTSDNLLSYTPGLTWYTQTSTGNNYLHFQANTSTEFLTTPIGKGIKLQSVANDSVDPYSPAMRFTFTSVYRPFVNGVVQAPVTHRECVFYEARYCGDGIKDARETCDPRDPSRTGFGSGGCDTNTCQPVQGTPVCNSIDVSTSTINVGETVSVTCNGTNADSFKIDCGNGQVFNSQTGVCTYGAAGTKTPTCSVNGNITGP